MFSFRNSYSFKTILYKSRFYYTYQDTIFALSSGLTKAGVSVSKHSSADEIPKNQHLLGDQSEWEGCF